MEGIRVSSIDLARATAAYAKAGGERPSGAADVDRRHSGLLLKLLAGVATLPSNCRLRQNIGKHYHYDPPSIIMVEGKCIRHGIFKLSIPAADAGPPDAYSLHISIHPIPSSIFPYFSVRSFILAYSYQYFSAEGYMLWLPNECAGNAHLISVDKYPFLSLLFTIYSNMLLWALLQHDKEERTAGCIVRWHSWSVTHQAYIFAASTCCYDGHSAHFLIAWPWKRAYLVNDFHLLKFRELLLGMELLITQNLLMY